MNSKVIAAVFIVLTVIFGATTGYFLTNKAATQTVTTSLLSTVTETTTVTSSSPHFTVNLVYKPGIGFYLTNATGFTLYFRQTDPGNGTSTCTGTCVNNWPLFYATNIVTPPSLNASAFTTIARPDGKQQTAFDGFPLYYYKSDVKPGEALGEGLGHFFACCTATATGASTTSSTATTTAGAFAIAISKGASTNQSSFGFSPSTVTLVIGVNNTVTWTNNDIAIHTVTSMSIPAGAKSFDSGDLAPGGSFTYSFTVAGTYIYHCEIHPWMQGTIVVKG